MTIQYGDDELSRVLRQTFPSVPKGRPPANLGEIVSAEVNNQGLSPGNTYQGGPQTQPAGVRGRKARRAIEKWDSVLGGVDVKQCGVFGNPDCLEAISRLLEQTFRNFQLASRRPSHVDPPFRATHIDEGSPTCPVVAPAAGTFVDVVSVTIPRGRFRAVISALGHSTEVVDDWANLEWRILVDTIPYPPYESVIFQMWGMVPPTKLESPIKLRDGQICTMQARSTSGSDINVLGRMAGWFYPTRSEDGGDSIRSTIVD